jgi:hypothetical protein
VGNNTTCFLVRVARSKDQYLMHPPSPMGPCQRRALAQSLTLIYSEVDRQLQAGNEPTEIDGTRCIGWDPDDPLEGDLTAISPFSMLDTWSTIESEASRECPERPEEPRRRPTPRVRERTHTDPLRPAVLWRVERLRPLPGGEGRNPPPPQNGDYINLIISDPPRDRITEFTWEMLSASNGRFPAIQQTSSARSVFQVGPGAPTYVVQVIVTTRSGRLRPAQLTIDTAEAPPPPPPPLPTDAELEGADPSGSPLPCDRENRRTWVTCARHDPSLADPIRDMLAQYQDRGLDDRFIRASDVRTHQTDASLSLRRINELARGTDPNRTIRSHQRHTIIYSDFLGRLRDMRAGVRQSANRILADTTRCTECITQSCVLLKDTWLYDMQRNPTSVYYFFSGN